MQSSIDNIKRNISYFVPLRDSCVVFWKSIKIENILGAEIDYFDKNNTPQKSIVPVSDLMSALYNVDISKPVSVRGMFTPAVGRAILDTFYSRPDTYNIADHQLHSMFLTGSSVTTGDYIDLLFVRNFPRTDQPNPITVASSIDIVHQRGTGSKQNLFTANSNQFTPFSADLAEFMNSWNIRNK